MMPTRARVAGPISVSEAVGHVVVLLLACKRWLDSGGKTTAISSEPCRLALTEVERIETELSASLPTDILAILAAELNVMGWQFRLGGLVELTYLAWERKMPTKLIALANWDDTFVAIDRRGAPDRDPFVTLYSEARGTGSRRELAGWLGSLVDEMVEDLPLGESEQEKMTRKDNLSRFAPTLVAGSEDVCTVRVAVHPKFGRGIIVAEQDGKYEIDFDSGERKRLLARFVTVEAREKAT